jgi:hypothetical protein
MHRQSGVLCLVYRFVAPNRFALRLTTDGGHGQLILQKHGCSTEYAAHVCSSVDGGVAVLNEPNTDGDPPLPTVRRLERTVKTGAVPTLSYLPQRGPQLWSATWVEEDMRRFFFLVVFVSCGPTMLPAVGVDAGQTDAGEVLRCPSSERACACESGTPGIQLCFEPGAVWSRCSCGAAPDAGADPDAGQRADGGVQDAGPVEVPDAQVPDSGFRRDAGFPPCPSAFQCVALGMSGVSACSGGASVAGVPSCSDAGTCDSLPGAMCRSVQGFERCIRFCTP